LTSPILGTFTVWHSFFARTAAGSPRLLSLIAAGLDRNAAAATLRFGDGCRNFKHAVLELRFRLIGVRPFGQRDRRLVASHEIYYSKGRKNVGRPYRLFKALLMNSYSRFLSQ